MDIWVQYLYQYLRADNLITANIYIFRINTTFSFKLFKENKQSLHWQFCVNNEHVYIFIPSSIFTPKCQKTVMEKTKAAHSLSYLLKHWYRLQGNLLKKILMQAAAAWFFSSISQSLESFIVTCQFTGAALVIFFTDLHIRKSYWNLKLINHSVEQLQKT